MATTVYETTFGIRESTPGTFDGNVEREDRGMAMIVNGDSDDAAEKGDGCMFVRLQSWDEGGAHPLLSSLIGKRVRVVVEVLD